MICMDECISMWKSYCFDLLKGFRYFEKTIRTQTSDLWSTLQDLSMCQYKGPLYFHNTESIFSKMNFWGLGGIKISEILEKRGYRNAGSPLQARDVATSRCFEAIEETYLKPAASQTDLWLLCFASF